MYLCWKRRELPIAVSYGLGMQSKLTGVEIVGIFHETVSAFTNLMNHKADLIFVDINMPRKNGLEFAERLRESGIDTKIMFITSHKEYALFAFDVHAFDYIVNPIVQDRLHKTILRVRAPVNQI